MKDFIVSHIYEIIYCFISIIANIGTLIAFLKAKKKVKTTEEKDKLQKEAIDRFKLTINQWIKDAEKLKHYTPAEKKQFVMVRAIAIAQGLMEEQQIDDYVESQIDLTNNVNVSRVKQVK